MNINPCALIYFLVTKPNSQVSWQPKQKEQDELCDSCYLQGESFFHFPFRAQNSSPGASTLPTPPQGMHPDLWFSSLWLASAWLCCLRSLLFSCLLACHPRGIGSLLDSEQEPIQAQEHWGQVGHASVGLHFTDARGPPAQGILQFTSLSEVAVLGVVPHHPSLSCPGPETQVSENLSLTLFFNF